MNQYANRYSPVLAWAYALGALAVGALIAMTMKSLPPKIYTGIYAALIGGAGFAAAFTTRARLRSVVGVFFVVGLVAAVTNYAIVSYFFKHAVSAMGNAMVTNDAGRANTAEAAGFMGRFFGIFAAAIGFLETFIVGALAAKAGSKAREQAIAAPHSYRTA